RLARVAHLPLHERRVRARWRPDQDVEHGADTHPKQADELPAREPPELALRPDYPARLEGGADLGELGPQNLEVKRLLGAVVVVARRDVDPRPLGDVAHRGPVEPPLGEEGSGGRDDTVLGGAAGSEHNRCLKHPFETRQEGPIPALRCPRSTLQTLMLAREYLSESRIRPRRCSKMHSSRNVLLSFPGGARGRGCNERGRKVGGGGWPGGAQSHGRGCTKTRG